MKLSSKRITIFGLLAGVLAFLPGLGCQQPPPPLTQEPIEITYWRVWDEKDDFQELFDAYTQLRPNVNINYRRLRFEEYEDTLIDALAEDRGPDIFSIPNTWVNKYRSKIQPMPSQVVLPITYVKGSVRKETVYELRAVPTTSTAEMRNNYIDVAYGDVVWDNQIYGLPLSVDTMVLYYNRDILNGAGIPQPPTDWREFQDQVKRITKLGSDGDILLGGAAIGTARNVQRSADILALLMMQNGAFMTSGNQAIFNLTPQGMDRSSSPGQEALRFYTDFAFPVKEVYTWNDDQPDSLEAFVTGRVAFFFGYSYHLPAIRSRAPGMNFGITAMPQIQGNPEVNFANYWVETVSRKSRYPDIAWGLVDFMSKAENVNTYLEKTGKPTALRSLILQQRDSPDLIVFASQLLTATSWYRGVDAEQAEEVLMDMIDSVVQGTATSEDAINFAAQLVTQTLR